MGFAMANYQNEHDKVFETMTKGWVEIKETEDPDQYQAWSHWRAENMNSFIQPKSFTVPSYYPPTTIAAVKEYFEAIKVSRRAIGWPKGIERLSKNPSAWMGGSGKAQS